MRRLGRIDRNADCPDGQNREVGDRPQGSALSEYCDAIALPNAEAIKSKRYVANALQQTLGCHANPGLVLLKAQNLPAGHCSDCLLEQFYKRLWLVIFHFSVLYLS